MQWSTQTRQAGQSHHINTASTYIRLGMGYKQALTTHLPRSSLRSYSLENGGVCCWLILTAVCTSQPLSESRLLAGPISVHCTLLQYSTVCTRTCWLIKDLLPQRLTPKGALITNESHYNNTLQLGLHTTCTCSDQCSDYTVRYQTRTQAYGSQVPTENSNDLIVERVCS